MTAVRTYHIVNPGWFAYRVVYLSGKVNIDKFIAIGYNGYTIFLIKTAMGMRKKINAIKKVERAKAKIKRDKAKLKRLKKAEALAKAK